MNTRRRIGFINYDEPTEAVATTVEKREESGIVLSSSHSELLEKIGNIVDLITGSQFAKMNKDEKLSYINVLISSVALEAELSAKTALLLNRGE
jgi:hypothetical protein